MSTQHTAPVPIGTHEIPVPCPLSYRGCLVHQPWGVVGLLAGTGPAGGPWVCWRQQQEAIHLWNLRFRRLCDVLDGRSSRGDR